jgi:hypothetical protein
MQQRGSGSTASAGRCGSEEGWGTGLAGMICSWVWNAVELRYGSCGCDAARVISMIGDTTLVGRSATLAGVLPEQHPRGTRTICPAFS